MIDMENEILFAEKMREIERLKRRTRQLEKRVEGVMWFLTIIVLLSLFG